MKDERKLGEMSDCDTDLTPGRVEIKGKMIGGKHLRLKCTSKRGCQGHQGVLKPALPVIGVS